MAKSKDDLCSQSLDLKLGKVANCTIKLKLDVRHESNDEYCPVSIYFFLNGERWYYPVGDRMTREEFYLVSHATGKGRIAMNSQGERPYDIKLRLEGLFDSFFAKLQQLHSKGRLTMDAIKTMMTGNTSADGEDFLSVWESEMKKKSLGTRDSYAIARNSFIKYVGHVPGFKVSIVEVKKWCDGMVADNLKKTTIGIYLRAFRAAWKACEKYGYLSHDDYPFGKGDTLVSIPKSATRRDSVLSVDQMTELYQCFVDKNYPEDWDTDWRENAHVSLGLFLAQYLCNGFNLADAARLTYDDHYFKSGKKSFRFIRQKTEDRSDTEVVIPIIEPLQYILDEIAAPPTKGALVFPQIYGGETDEVKRKARVSQENKNIRTRMSRLVKSLDWEIEPTSTWCRHSFATNLSHAGGVPKEYISEAMGHSISGGAVTDLYIQTYPLSMQMQFNSKLLKAEGQETLMDKLQEFSLEELQAAIAIMEKNRAGE